MRAYKPFHKKCSSQHTFLKWIAPTPPHVRRRKLAVNTRQQEDKKKKIGKRKIKTWEGTSLLCYVQLVLALPWFPSACKPVPPLHYLNVARETKSTVSASKWRHVEPPRGRKTKEVCVERRRLNWERWKGTFDTSGWRSGRLARRKALGSS